MFVRTNNYRLYSTFNEQTTTKKEDEAKAK
jgi:hypothetical protein